MIINAREIIHQLLQEHEQLLKESIEHLENEQFEHRLHAIKENLTHLKELLREENLEKTEREKKFFEHHLAVIHHINEHFSHVRHHVSHLLHDAEMERIRIEILNLLQELDHPTHSPSTAPQLTLSPHKTSSDEQEK